jgi:rhodanese-related sulfurtransferase
MKKFIIQLSIILLLSAVVGFAFNHFQKSPLPVLKKFVPPAVAQDSNEDLSKFYSEMDADTLRGLLDSDMIILLDARTANNFQKGHIAKAVSLPVSEFNKKYDLVSGLLTSDKTIVLYCIGINCIDSSLLARELFNKGHRNIFVYKGGIEEWESLGYPVESQNGGGNSK